jgi:hypothetical protein
MWTKFNIVVAAAMVTVLCAPAVAFDQQSAYQKTQALRQVGSVKAQGFGRAVQGAYGEAGGYVQGGPYSSSRVEAQSRAHPEQTCNYFGGNGGPVRVCW